MQSKSYLGDFALGKTIGKGRSGKVKLATAPDGQKYAVKIFDRSQRTFGPSALREFRQEVKAMQAIKSDRVLQHISSSEQSKLYKADGTSQNVAYIVSEYAARGELFDLIVKTGPLEESIARTLAKQVLDGVRAIHSKGFAHRDLKPENILVDKKFNLKIADLGYTSPVCGFEDTIYCGTQGYMAPEIRMKSVYQTAVADLFAFGVVLFMLRAGRPPFFTADQSDRFYRQIALRNYDAFWRVHSKHLPEGFFSEEFKELISLLLAFQPFERPALADIYAHPWF